MEIPKKISPDNLKDSIVEIAFESDVPKELLLGAYFYNLIEDYEYVTSSHQSSRIIDNLRVEQFEESYFIHKNKKVKINTTPRGITFNCLEKYIGWSDYFSIISHTIKTLFKANTIKKITRIGVRYISKFDNMDLRDTLKLNLALDIPNRDLNSTQIRTEFKDEAFTIILTLFNRIRTADGEFSSIIDIDVINKDSNLESIEETLELINRGHKKEKEMFFSLLQTDFLATLNPEY